MNKLNTSSQKYVRQSLLFATILIISFQLANAQQPDTVIVIGDSTLVSPGEDVLLEGRVINAETGNPMQGVAVFIEKLGRGAVTDSSGNYRLGLSTGRYSIRFQFLGFHSVTKEIHLFSGGILNVSMTGQLLDLDEVVIEATGYDDNVLSPITGIEQLSVTELKELPTVLGEADVVNALLLLPGVNSVGEGASGFNVRGGRVDQNLVLMDGVPVLNSAHVLSLFSVFNPDIAEGFTLYKGHIPARYGGRLSSVLDVDMKTGSLEKFGFTGGVGITSGRLMFEGPIKKDQTSFLVGGRGSFSDWLLGLVNNQDIRTSSATFYDGNAKISHRFNNNHRLAASLYGSYDKFRFSDQFGFSWGNQIYSVEWNSSLRQDLIANFTAAYGRYNSTNFEPVGVDAFNLDNGMNYLQLKENVLFKPNERHILNAGIKWITYDSQTEELEPYNSSSGVVPDRVDKEKGRELSLYASDDITLSNRLLLAVGVRFSLYQHLGPDRVFEYREGMARNEDSVIDTTSFGSGEVIKSYSGIEPRVSARYRLGQNNSLKLSYNRTRQYIHLISNNISPTPSDFWQVSTRHIPPQTADNFSLGYFQNFDNGRWETSLELFYKNIDNLVEYINFADLFLNEQLETQLFSADGRAYGLEVNIRKSRGGWTGWLSYTYSRSEVKAGSEFSELKINQGKWFASNYDQPHTLTFSAKRRLMEESAFSVNFTLQSGRPFTALESSYKEDGTSIPVFTNRNEERIPYYMRFDVSLKIADDIWKNWDPDPNRRYQDSLTISIYNVFSRDNAFSVFYKRPDEGSTLPKAHKLSVLGATIPSITYNFSF